MLVTNPNLPINFSFFQIIAMHNYKHFLFVIWNIAKKKIHILDFILQ